MIVKNKKKNKKKLSKIYLNNKLIKFKISKKMMKIYNLKKSDKKYKKVIQI